MELASITPEQWRIVWGFVKSQMRGVPSPRIGATDPQFHTVSFRNDSSEEIPPFAAMRITGVAMLDDQIVLTVNKPDSSTFETLINGPQAVATTASGDRNIGTGYKYGILQAKVEPGRTLGETLKAKASSWELEDGTGPFIFLGYDTEYDCGLVRYAASAGGGGGEHGVIIKTPSGGIAARSGTTVSSASCDVFSIVGTTLTDTGNNIDVYNISISPVGASKYGLAKKEYATGKWVIDFEDCS